MKTIRTVLTVATIALLGLGYAASQFAYFQGQEATIAYAQRIDSPPVRLLSLVLLVAAVVLGFVREPEADRS